MNPIFNKNLFFIKEHTGVFKAANNYDVYDPENNQMILNCRESNLGTFTKIFRFTKYKKFTPFYIEIAPVNSKKILSIKRGVAFFRSDVEVFDENDQLIGIFKQKFWSIGGKFELFDATGNLVCILQGKWTGWEFKFLKNEKELAMVTKKWAGLGKELFTTADNYVLQIHSIVPENDPVRKLIMAAIMCIDMVLKEGN
jgi:uncharacterized protein YxjI